MQKKKEDIKVEIFSGGIIRNDEGKLFFARGKKFDGKYIFPGGSIQEGETAEEAAVREVKEETNMDVVVEDQLRFGEFINRKEKAYAGQRFFLCDFVLKYEGDGSEIVLNEEYEKDSGKWFTLEESLELDFGGNVKEVVEAYKALLEREYALEGWRRSVAEFENYKKSKMNLEQDLAGRAIEEFAYKLLPVVDNFHASTDHIPEDQKDGGWVQGIMYIQKQLTQVLSDMNVVEIEANVGDVFDPEVHEAVEVTDDKQSTINDKEDETENGKRKTDNNNKNIIKKVLVKGYKRGDRVIRPARVTVG